MVIPNRSNEDTVEPKFKSKRHSPEKYVSLAEQFQNSVNDAVRELLERDEILGLGLTNLHYKGR